MNQERQIHEAARCVREADALIIGAGAGMGVDSGLPDFRGNQGFWNAYPPFKKLGLSFIDMANPGWFSRDPNLAWGFYGHRLNLYRRITPHPGFQLLRNWGQIKSNGYFVFTSNVDGQFQRAGLSEQHILECHGSIHHLQCSGSCGEIWSAQDVRVEVDESTMRAQAPLPTCPTCDRIARPNILMFGDWGWCSEREEHQSSRFSKWLQDCRQPVLIECGAGTAVPTVRSTMEHLARQYQVPLVRINLDQSHGPKGTISLTGRAQAILEQIQVEMDRLG